MKQTGPTNVVLKQTINLLRKQSKVNDAKIWDKIADDLGKSTRSRYIVNLSKIDRFTKDGDTVIVPGKVLGDGSLNHNVNIAAFKFSDSAKDKLGKTKSKFMMIEEIVKQNPKGSNVKIII